MMTRTPLGKQISTQSGLTLVEMMISMLLGLFVIAGIIQIFASSRQTYRVNEAISRMQENGRMALEIISRDLRMSDFWSCAGDVTNVVNNLDNAQPGFIDFGMGGIGGTESVGGAPDTLILRGGVDESLRLLPPYGPQTSAALRISSDNGLQQGDIVFVSDCKDGDIFQITNANPDTSGQLIHNTGNTVSPGNSNPFNVGCPGANAHCLSKVYGPDASIFAARQTTYTIGPGSEGQPALLRNGLEYIDGVENLQILYGENTDAPGTAGFGIANYYVPADQVVDMDNVVSIRFAIVVRSYDDNLSGGIVQNYNLLGANVVAPDNRLRQVYTSTVTIRNRL